MDICEYNKQYDEVLLVSGQRQVQILDLVQTVTHFTMGNMQYQSQWKGVFESTDVFTPEEDVFLEHSKFKGTVIITEKNGRYYSFAGIGRIQWRK